MCPCLGARRVIVGRGSGCEQTVFATFGSRGACVGEDFLLCCVAFSTDFFVQLRSSPCGGGLFPLFIVGVQLVAQCLRFSLLPALWRAARLVGVVC